MFESYKIKLAKPYKNHPAGTLLENVSLRVLADLRRRGVIEDPRDLREAEPFAEDVKEASRKLKETKKKKSKN